MKYAITILLLLAGGGCHREAKTTIDKAIQTAIVEQPQPSRQRIHTLQQYPDNWDSTEMMRALLEEYCQVEGIRQLNGQLDTYAYKDRHFSYCRNADYFIEYPPEFIPKHYSSGDKDIRDCQIVSPDTTVFICTYGYIQDTYMEEKIYEDKEIIDGWLMFRKWCSFRGCAYTDKTHTAVLYISVPVEKEDLIHKYRKYIDAFPHINLTE